MEMNTQNITQTGNNVKPEMPKTVGPWRNQREAANAAKDDILCQRHEYFHVVKNSGAYSYVTGTNPPLFSADLVVATYYFMAGRVWSYPRIGGK